ncbi:hypothetical protein BASA50_000242 [Batrachochytrium salamandrivorans]|uniref:Dynein assembly factor 3, axonemal n=1 Tax=Batrachochytrium salamandrivorans TaxID=1357716 RepID=A0ABQ8EUS8_9FUNG|nr:hypothetical protein BASA62_009940 [Batrachochytrium salamandrivorans]KAH6573099.1 hypothetical protein BASA62_003133 [Batrachochytrium salamandrivorans]KAH6586878.1 hypothetical protein BASA50_000242 [Batrachochytrium salamandrivorans]
MTSALLQGTGTTALWGYSKALDLQDIDGTLDERDSTLPASIPTQDGTLDEPLNILLIGASDIRHIIKTAARSWKYTPRKIHFHIIESQSSLLARDMLLLSIIVDHLDDIGIQERTELFLECYGNLLLRKKTSSWINSQSSSLIRAMTDGTGILGKMIDFSNLKFRERDDIESVLKFWRDEKKSFDAKSLWDARLQKFYGKRYDTRDNSIDWDYHMTIRDMDKKTSIIYKSEFLRWRMHGIAFEVRESSYECANRSLATVDLLKQDGVSVAKWGYFSDILLGPYLAFGIDTELKTLLATNNDHHKHTSQEVSEFNIRSLIHELNTGTPYETTETLKITNADNPAYSILDRIKISFLPCDVSSTLEKKRTKLAGKFQKIFISNAMAHRLVDAAHVLHPNGEIVVETAKFMVELTKELRGEFKEKILTMANMAGLKYKNSKEMTSNPEFMVFGK